ncbi:MAG: endonuclease/exonuclease/phosphatase family protein [Polyangiaceae bacterium]|nr:endonuclease/exonuclease/phosphatase family protein [Polyangiaceae bacterium]
MSELRVASWNVLHRVHGLNWGESVVAAFPEEKPRIEGITARVRALLDDGVQAIGLQEVSGDLLAELRRALVGRGYLFAYRLPRLPRMRQEGPSGLVDVSEHLVVVAADPRTTLYRAKAFQEDHGKGFLGVNLGEGVRFLCTHVSFGARSRVQLGLLATEGSLAPVGAVLVGDFNAPMGAVAAGLGEGWMLSDLRGQGPTRVNVSGKQDKVIDHLAVHRGKIREARVMKAEGLSDHHLVIGVIDGMER